MRSQWGTGGKHPNPRTECDMCNRRDTEISQYPKGGGDLLGKERQEKRFLKEVKFTVCYNQCVGF